MEEQAQETDQQVRSLLDEGDTEAALSLFVEMHMADQADVLARLALEPQREVLASLTVGQTAGIFDYLNPEELERLAEGIESGALAQVLDQTRPEVAADVLRRLTSERSDAVLEAMTEAHEVTPLLAYADDTAGGLMTPEFPVVNGGRTSALALDVLRLLGPVAEAFGLVFVVDDEDRLIGSVSVTKLALAQPTATVRDLMNPDVLAVSVTTDQEACAHLMERYDLRHLPVEDEDHRLIGVIQVEDVVEVVEEEATEDMYRIAGVSGERLYGTLGAAMRQRLPWLYINLGTTLVAASVIGLFESTIAQVAVLAVFLPVIAGQGGIGGTQALTLVVRAMALGEVMPGLGQRLLMKELLLGVVNGALLALGVGVVAYAWKGNATLSLILGAAMLGNMVVAGLAGAGIPLLLRRLRMDPAVSSAVFVTTITDVVGFLLFLGLAAALLSLLL